MKENLQKKCKRCGQIKDLNLFKIERSNTDGRSGTCRGCYEIRRKENVLKRKDTEIVAFIYQD